MEEEPMLAPQPSDKVNIKILFHDKLIVYNHNHLKKWTL
jgi:hypothetical protein